LHYICSTGARYRGLSTKIHQVCGVRCRALKGWLTPHVPNPGKYPALPITECFINYDFVTIADELPEKNYNYRIQ